MSSRLSRYLFVLIFIAGGTGCSALRLSGSNGNVDAARESAGLALARISVAQPDWKTLGISVSRDDVLPPATLWNYWSNLNAWPEWDGALTESTAWVGAPGWRSGATFDRTLKLGFPVGRLQLNEQVSEIQPGRLVGWVRDEGSIHSAHLWQFQPLPNGGTRIIETEVYHGWQMFFARPFVGHRWRVRFEQGIAGLIAAASKATPSAP